MKFLTSFTLGVILASLVSIVSAHEYVDYANNPYSPTHNHRYRRGVIPDQETWKKMRNYGRQFGTATVNSKVLVYGGGINGIGVTSGTPKVYLIFWGSQWGTTSTDANGNITFSNDIAAAAPALQDLFKGLGTGGEGWSGTMTQYCDGPLVSKGATDCPNGAPHVGYPSGGALAGVWYDNSAKEPTSATPAQIAQEAINAAAHFGNTTAESNRYVQYLIVSSTGLHPDGFNTSSGQFCAWHDYTGDTSLGGPTSPYGDLAFSNIPYMYDAGTSCGANAVNSGSAGKLDGMTMGTGHEYAETITDQNPPGGWLSASGSQENGDECAWITSGQGTMANVNFATGTFAMQSTWSNDTNECDMTHAIIGASVNTTPVASSGSVKTSESSPVDGILVASDSDGDTLLFSIASNPSHGTAVITNINTGAFTYTPAGGYSGNDSFTFKATDGSGNVSNVATESVTITANTNTAPVASNGSVSTNADTAVSAKLAATDSDGDALTYSIVTQPSHGSVSLTNTATGTFTYTPISGFAGSDSFSFKATDSAGNTSNIATESVTVNAVTTACPTGYTHYSGTIFQGRVSNTPHYYYARAGKEAATLSGPVGTNFDLYLYWWNGWTWLNVARSTGPTSTESITSNYSPTGYFGWQIYARSGSGTFDMCVSHP